MIATAHTFSFKHTNTHTCIHSLPHTQTHTQTDLLQLQQGFPYLSNIAQLQFRLFNNIAFTHSITHHYNVVSRLLTEATQTELLTCRDTRQLASQFTQMGKMLRPMCRHLLVDSSVVPPSGDIKHWCFSNGIRASTEVMKAVGISNQPT